MSMFTYRSRSVPNRTLCDVLNEARKCYETRNFSYLLGLIEEAQVMGNKMEAALFDQNDLKYAQKELKKVNEKLEKQKDLLKETKTDDND